MGAGQASTREGGEDLGTVFAGRSVVSLEDDLLEGAGSKCFAKDYSFLFEKL